MALICLSVCQFVLFVFLFCLSSVLSVCIPLLLSTDRPTGRSGFTVCLSAFMYKYALKMDIIVSDSNLCYPAFFRLDLAQFSFLTEYNILLVKKIAYSSFIVLKLNTLQNISKA